MKDLIFQIFSSSEQREQFLHAIHNEKINRVLLCNEFEYEYYNWTNNSDIFLETIKTGIERNFKVYVLSSMKDMPPNMPPDEIKSFSNNYIHLQFPTIFFNEYVKSRYAKIFFKLKEKNIDYHFITMNLKPHWFRMYMIDQLAERDLLKFARYSWLENNPDYSFQHYDGQISRLDDFHITRNQFSLPDIYHSAFAQLVSETAHDTIFLSEKTVVPLLMQKPFLSCAALNFHRYLRELGFEEYTEIFDYSFDTIMDTKLRFSAVIDNFEKLTKLDIYTLREIYNSILPKLRRNRERALEIANDKNLVPGVLYTFDKETLRIDNFTLYQIIY